LRDHSLLLAFLSSRLSRRHSVLLLSTDLLLLRHLSELKLRSFLALHAFLLPHLSRCLAEYLPLLLWLTKFPLRLSLDAHLLLRLPEHTLLLLRLRPKDLLRLSVGALLLRLRLWPHLRHLPKLRLLSLGHLAHLLLRLRPLLALLLHLRLAAATAVATTPSAALLLGRRTSAMRVAATASVALALTKNVLI
jgi:hypothetical protein